MKIEVWYTANVKNPLTSENAGYHERAFVTESEGDPESVQRSARACADKLSEFANSFKMFSFSYNAENGEFSFGSLHEVHLSSRIQFTEGGGGGWLDKDQFRQKVGEYLP